MFTIEPKKIRQRIIELAYNSGKNGSHIGGSFSLVEVYSVLFNSVLRGNGKLTSDDRDRLIVSKGHSALALFCLLESIGLISTEELNSFESNGSDYYAHAKRDISKGIEFSGGSLSLGISYAVGVALACKDKKIDNHLFVILGDGECDEGLVWEAAMSIANFSLNNITLIVDKNGLQSDGFTKDVMNHFSLSNKFTSFGFHTVEVNGHSEDELLKAFNNRDKDRPNAIIARTIKGKGVSFMENERSWHHNVLNQSHYQLALDELK